MRAEEWAGWIAMGLFTVIVLGIFIGGCIVGRVTA